MTALTEETFIGANGKPFVGITEDFGWTMNKRNYKGHTATLTKIGVADFDNAPKI